MALLYETVPALKILELFEMEICYSSPALAFSEFEKRRTLSCSQRILTIILSEYVQLAAVIREGNFFMRGS
jgi:hypothetical protein